MQHSNTFPVTHLHTKQVFQRNHILLNPHHASASTSSSSEIDPAIERFHTSLPHYAETPLTSLPDLARDLGVSHVFVKDESLRFGLPSFKILGASWAIYCAICDIAHLPPTVSLDQVALAAQEKGITLVTCSAGNWGRAVARMGSYLGVGVTVFVFNGVGEATKRKIQREGAVVLTVDGTYDDSIQAAISEGEKADSLLVMDTSWHGFEKIPQNVVDGYSTMLKETERQIRIACGRRPTICVTPVGVGSIAQAVTAYYTSTDDSIHVITVESEAAPCLIESLHTGMITPLQTGETIMPPLNCGTVSTLAWPVLKAGVYAATAISDVQCHENLDYLTVNGVAAGPCGGATLAAAKMLHKSDLIAKGSDAVLVLFSTEGVRDYAVPC